MQKNRHRMTKTIVALLLTIVMATSFGAFGPKQTMAAGGAVTVSLANAEGLSPDTTFKFEMYKVGHFNGPGLELEANLKDSGADVDFPSGSSEAADVKAERMLASASKLASYIDDNDIELEPVKTFTLKPGESTSPISVGENALYLVRSHTIRDADSKKYNWTPQSVYVAVLENDSSITISNDVVTKIVRTPVAFNHQVQKMWDIPQDVQVSKPSAVFVNIRYGSKIVDTVKLSDDNSWKYNWTSEEDGDTYKYIGTDDEGNAKVIEFAPEGDPEWSCDEVLDAQYYADNFERFAYSNARARNFTADELEAIKKTALRFTAYPDELEDAGEIASTPEEQAKQTSIHTVTNVYAKKGLELTKRLDGYVDAGDRSNVTTAFRIVAKDAAGNEVYNNTLGISFAKNDEVDDEGYYTKTKQITDIPANAKEITVTEVYSGQYEGDSEKSNQGENPEIVFDTEKNLWTVTMDNTHNFHQGSGVVNKYGDGDLKDREGYIKHK